MAKERATLLIHVRGVTDRSPVPGPASGAIAGGDDAYGGGTDGHAENDEEGKYDRVLVVSEEAIAVLITPEMPTMHFLTLAPHFFLFWFVFM